MIQNQGKPTFAAHLSAWRLKMRDRIKPTPMIEEEDIYRPRPYVQVPMDRRVEAFIIDFVATAIISLSAGSAYIVMFLLTWLALRVIVVAVNRGQSLGRWAVNIKVVDPRQRRIPSLVELFQRELITGLAGLLVVMGLANFNPANAWVLFTPIPLLADCSLAFGDPDYRRAFHDRVVGTTMVQTRRGASFDLLLRDLFAEVRRRVK
jgi:uncharacterized RDD family membrane protein YckC